MVNNLDTQLRSAIRSSYIADEEVTVRNLIDYLDLSDSSLERIQTKATNYVETLRTSATPGMMESFLAEYGLSTQEGVALMCLAEALLRVPDDVTIDALIQDKIAPADWSSHLGHSSSPLVNSSTWALMLTGKVIDQKEVKKWDVTANIRTLIKRAGEPIIRKAVAQSMKILGHQFVLGRNIDEAMKRAKGMEDDGYTYSYDMLGEAAHTAEDAQKYFMAYTRAISSISNNSTAQDIRDNPGISVKLSALHPRYEFLKHKRIIEELIPRVSSLVHQAKNANMGFNIDAEEADRLDISLDVIEAVLSNPDLKGWDGFGVVVQAYSSRASFVLDWLYALAKRLDRKIMVRLVKGAYWDTEIKLSQVNGIDGYPVFTRKASTDISYMSCAKKLLQMTDHIYPQFATHNAHSAAAIIEFAGDQDNYEFQRLHGMGEALHKVVKDENKSRCRIYAPVGIHEDLLAYLVRRLLENGANSSFVNQVLDEAVPASEVVKDPVIEILGKKTISNPTIPNPLEIYSENRRNSVGRNIANPPVLKALEENRKNYRTASWHAAPIVGGIALDGEKKSVYNPSDHSDCVGEVIEASTEQVESAISLAFEAKTAWAERPAVERAECLDKIADLYEENYDQLMAMLSREAGKSILDGIAEVREAVDFCRYYALRAIELEKDKNIESRGIFSCISPWNFPLAIFTGQVVAALSVGNCVIAKPAGQTPLIASFAVELMLKAGIPGNVVALLPGGGSTVGNQITTDSRISGVCFTGSTATAQRVNMAMAKNLDPTAPLIAETGGLNSMIVDSSALPEQVTRDVIASAFQSAGQRCSALRMLYLQEDIADKVIGMLKGAMDELEMGDPWHVTTDVGPVIDEGARNIIEQHCIEMEKQGRLIKKLDMDLLQNKGTFVAPAIYKVDGIESLEKEIFGPILHIATFKAKDILKVVDNVNDSKYGLTFGIHTRVNNRVQEVCEAAKVGNLYVNRNQIGAVVGVQPFGGEGLSGTGPKAGGPIYLRRFTQKKGGFSADTHENPLGNNAPYSTKEKSALSATLANAHAAQITWDKNKNRHAQIIATLSAQTEKSTKIIHDVIAVLENYDPITKELVGPTGESNQLSVHGRGVILCCGKDAVYNATLSLLTGNAAVIVEGGELAKTFKDAMRGFGETLAISDLPLNINELKTLNGIAGIALNENDYDLTEIRQALAAREGMIIPALTDKNDWTGFITERALCIDTTASGGNADLLATVNQD